MKWEKEMESKLKEYPYKKNALTEIKNRINFIRDTIYSLKPMGNTDPVQGGGSKQEDYLLNRIVEKNELEKTYKDLLYDVRFVDRALKCLNDKEKEVIELYYLNTVRLKIETICDRMGYEKSSVYRIKDDALKKMVIFMYGRIIS